MIIQDTIMGLTSIIFVVSLFIQFIKVLKTKNTTSFSYYLTFGNSIALAIMCACMFSVGLHFSASVLVLQGLLWLSIGILKIKYER